MRLNTLITSVFIAGFATHSLAQTLQERLFTAPEISFQEWQEMTAGRTVVYEIDGTTFAFEAYRQNSNRIDIRLDGGGCVSGTWFMDENAFCFDWQDGPLNCFNHKRLDDDIYVIGLENGVETADIQKVSRIAAIPVQCGPALLSLLEPEASP